VSSSGERGAIAPVSHFAAWRQAFWLAGVQQLTWHFRIYGRGKPLEKSLRS
jgi:hypothetical protein